MTGADDAVRVEVSVAGVQELRLVVDQNGNNNSDHADWAGARLLQGAVESMGIKLEILYMDHIKKSKGLVSHMNHYISIVLISICMLAGCGNDMPVAPNSQATFGNLLNLGLAASDGNFIYYTIWENGTQCMMRAPYDGGQKQKLLEGNYTHLNLTEDAIYYINVQDNHCVYRMDKNGGGETKISDVSAQFLAVYGGRLYVQTEGRLVSMDLDGQSLETIIDEIVLQIYIYQDKIYYVYRNDERHSLCRVDITGENKEMILEDAAMDRFIIANDEVFYTGISGHNLYCFRLTTRETQLLAEGMFPTMSIITDGQYLYGYNLYDVTGGFIKLDLKTKHTAQNIRQKATHNYIVGNAILHYENDIPYIMSLDGAGNQQF